MALLRCQMKYIFLTVIVLFLVYSILGLVHLMQEQEEYVPYWDEMWGPEVERYHAEIVDQLQGKDNLSSLPIKHPIILWWTPFTGAPSGIRQCAHHKCFFTQLRGFKNNPQTKVFMFYGSDFKPTDLPLPRKSTHQWALLHEESPKNNMLFSHAEIMELFNHTATFKRESSFPLTLQYLQSLEALKKTKYFVPTEEKNLLQSELAPLVYVHSDCDTPSDRDSFVKELMKYIKVDSYGSCLHNKDLPKHLSDPIEGMDHPDFYKLMAQYKFTLSFENAVCDDYITEKLWRPLVLGSVPVYYGSPTVSDWLPNENSAILVQDFKSPKELAKFIQDLNENDALYEEYLLHKLNGTITNKRLMEAVEDREWGINNDLVKGNFIEHFECFVCRRINELQNAVRLGFPAIPYQATVEHYGCPIPTSPFIEMPSGENWWTSLYQKSSVEAFVLSNLIVKGKNFTKKQFYDEVLNILNHPEAHLQDFA